MLFREILFDDVHQHYIYSVFLVGIGSIDLIPAQGACGGVLDGSEQALLAEHVAAGGRDRLEEDLEA